MKNLVLLLLLFASSNVIACKCDEFNVSGYVKFANKVYSGHLIASEEFGDKGYVSASVKVTEKFVGETYEIEEAIVTTHNICGLNLEIGKTYLVFEQENGHVNFCTMRKFEHVQNLEWNLARLRDLSKSGI